LLLDVVHDGFVGHMARARHKVPPPPYVPTPEFPTESLEFDQHLSRGLALDPLHQLTYRDMRWYRHKDVHMVGRNMPLHNFYVPGFADLTDQIPHSFSYGSSQNGLAVLRDPNEVILDVVDCVAGSPVVFHAASLLKSSPKGEGFSPIPRVGQ
jgi:hypothetical protein